MRNTLYLWGGSSVPDFACAQSGLRRVARMELLRHPGKPRRATPRAYEPARQPRISLALNPGYSCYSFE
jgi:hypothetical protein